jgi:hypothetical protein
MLIMRNEAIANFQPRASYGIEFFIETNKCALVKTDGKFKPKTNELVDTKEYVA